KVIGHDIDSNFTPNFLDQYYTNGSAQITGPVFKNAAAVYEVDRIKFINKALQDGFSTNPAALGLSGAQLQELTRQGFLTYHKPPGKLSPDELAQWQADPAHYSRKEKRVAMLVEPDGTLNFAVLTGGSDD